MLTDLRTIFKHPVGQWFRCYNPPPSARWPITGLSARFGGPGAVDDAMAL
jgi:hypothetical protein